MIANQIFDRILARWASLPEGLEDVSTFPDLVAELLRRGYSEPQVKKVVGLNLLRVMRDVEKVAARLRRQRPASDRTIEEMDGEATKRLSN